MQLHGSPRWFGFQGTTPAPRWGLRSCPQPRTERPSPPRRPQPGGLGGGPGAAGLFQAPVQPRRDASAHEGTEYSDVLKDIVKNCNSGQIWLFKETSIQRRFGWSCISSFCTEQFRGIGCVSIVFAAVRNTKSEESRFFFGCFEAESRTKAPHPEGFPPREPCSSPR